VLPLLFVFVVAQLAVGVWASRRVASQDDYLVAGRRLGPVLATASIFATWFGAESCIGAAGTAYDEGVGATTTEPFAYGICLVLMGLLFAARFHRARLTTLADFFAQRFGHAPERLAAVLLVPSSLLWAAAQIQAFGHIVETNSADALSETTAIAIAAVVAIVYTATGGLLADVYTDVVQGAVLVLGLAALSIAVLLAPDPSTTAAAAAAAALPPTANAVLHPTTLLDVVERWAIPLCGSVVAQEALSRCLAARTPSIARRAALLGGALYLVLGAIPLALGLVGRDLVQLENGEKVLPHLAQTLLPPALNVLFAGALVSAILSTVDSCLLVVAAIVTRNLAPQRADAAPGSGLALARAITVAAGLAALGLALTSWDVAELVEQASGFGSSGVFVLALLGTYTRAGGPAAALLALAGGLVTWVLGSYVLTPELVPHPYLTSLAAAFAGFAAGCALDRGRLKRGTR
jgi:Na+/proline symporter